MSRSNKLVKNVDEDSWRKFVAFCKYKGVRVSDELKIALEAYVKRGFKKLIK